MYYLYILYIKTIWHRRKQWKKITKNSANWVGGREYMHVCVYVKYSLATNASKWLWIEKWVPCGTEDKVMVFFKKLIIIKINGESRRGRWNERRQAKK